MIDYMPQMAVSFYVQMTIPYQSSKNTWYISTWINSQIRYPTWLYKFCKTATGQLECNLECLYNLLWNVGHVCSSIMAGCTGYQVRVNILGHNLQDINVQFQRLKPLIEHM